jgi:hypothetical protein
MGDPDSPARAPLPQGIQRLLRMAADDGGFADDLVARRGAAADDAGVELTPSEKAVLESTDETQLRTMIAALPDLDDVPLPIGEAIVTLGITPDEPPPMVCQGIAPDIPPVSRGHSANIPGRLWRWLRRK